MIQPIKAQSRQPSTNEIGPYLGCELEDPGLHLGPQFGGRVLTFVEVAVLVVTRLGHQGLLVD